MKDKHYLYRVAVTCDADSPFYETGNARRCHALMPFAHYANSLRNRKEHMPQLSALRPFGTPRGGTDTAGSQRTSASVRPAGHEMSGDADGSSSARTPPAAGNRTPSCGPAGIGTHRRLAARMFVQGAEGTLPAARRLRPPIRGAEPQPAAPDPSRRPAARHESEDRITAKNKTRCRVLFFCLTPETLGRRSCRKGYFRAARPGRRAS